MDNNMTIEADEISETRSVPRQLIAFTTLACCLLLAIIGTDLFTDVFFVHGRLLGINVVVFTILLMLCVFLLRKLEKHPISKNGHVLMASSLFFAFTFAWRDSLVLNSLSIFALIIIIIMGFSLKAQKKLQTIYATELVNDFSASFKYGLTSYHQLLRKDVQWHEVQRVRRMYGRAVSKGLLLTTPLFSVFMILLIASDARFERLVYALFDWGWELSKTAQYSMVFIVISLFVAAILRVSILTKDVEVCQVCDNLPRWSLGKIEIMMLLGTLNFLFFGFIAVQFSYFFGGDALVQSLDGLTYSEYARRGFFQLVIVAILVIILLLFSHWSYKSVSDEGDKIYTWLAAIMLLLTITIELSAAHRMSLYTSVYGLTELRFYTSVFMFCLLLLFAWFSATVLRGKREYFSFGAVVSALFCIGMLHVVNPDAVIADVNLERYQDGQQVDITYLSSLSADVVPDLYDALTTTVKTNFMCNELWHKLQQHKVLQADTNWRYFNLSRYQASKLLMSANETHCQLE